MTEKIKFDKAYDHRRKAASDLLFRTPYGKGRREGILRLLAGEFGDIPVNRRYCCIIDKDPDLKYLLKKGKIARFRRYDSPKTSYTWITLVK